MRGAGVGTKMFRPFIVQWFPFNTAVDQKSLSNSMKESLCQNPINFAKSETIRSKLGSVWCCILIGLYQGI